MMNHSDFTTLATTWILLVDLNAFLPRVEHDISVHAKVTGDYNISEHFLKASKARHKAIKAVFWDAKKGQWLDY
ncbi:hypothetical protein ACFX13_015213 [Malus domestica]